MGIARYEIHVPVESRRATIATHQYLTGGQVPGLKAATVQYGYPNDLLVIAGEETPELDSHVKQTGTLLGDVANLPWVEITKVGKNHAHWTMNNPHYAPEPVQAPSMFPEPMQGPMGAPQMQYAAGIADPDWQPEGWDQEAFGPHGRCPMCKNPNLLELDGSLICPECQWAGQVFHTEKTGEPCPVCGGRGFVETADSGSRCTNCDGSGTI